jgi:CMP-N-acetylneuraminic acid synthetase
MKTLAIYLNVRKNSSRCKNKLLKFFAGTCLFDIALKKLEQVRSDEKFVCAYDREFFEYQHNSSIKHYVRSKESVSIDGPLTKVFECYNSFQSDYVMFLNPSHAHLRVDTIQSAVDFFKASNYESMTSVEKINDWIFDNDGKLLYPSDLAHGDTKRTDPSYRAAHAFHIYSRKRFIDNNGLIWPWLKNDPHLFEISKIESLDVDDEVDFKISESVYLAHLD